MIVQRTEEEDCAMPCVRTIISSAKLSCCWLVRPQPSRGRVKWRTAHDCILDTDTLRTHARNAARTSEICRSATHVVQYM